jgi:peroxiredoxin
MTVMIVGMALPWLVVSLFVALGGWVGFQLVHQNGRLLAHLEALEQRLAGWPSPPSALSQKLGEGEPVNGPEYRSPLAQSLGEGPGVRAASAAPAGLAIGSLAPAFELPDLAGGRKKLADFRGRKLLLLFFNPGCGFCTRIAAELAALPIDGAGGAPLPLILTTGEAEANLRLVSDHLIRCPVLLQQSMEVASQYQCNGTPMGYLIDEQGRIASEMAIGGPALLALAADPPASQVPGRQAPDAGGNGAGPLGGKRELSESKLQRDGLPAGTPAPEFRLPLLHGGELSLSEYRGRKVLLVFSDPNCGPCDQLAPRLEQLARRTAGVQVLMVSKGQERSDARWEANRAKAAEHGLTFPIVLQKQWEVSKEYAKFATPIGYLIDEEGIIAKEIAIGVEPILALLSAPAIVPTNGKGPVPHPGRDLAGRR